MIKQAIILAGGLGTRLRSVVSEQPKCMASVAGKPFLHYVINYLQGQGIEQFIFALGYKHEMIKAYVDKEYSSLAVDYVVEEEPLGTGGAIKLACSKAKETDILILNGDTIFSVDIQSLSALHEEKKSSCTLSLKPMQDFDRYGVVTIDDEQRINSFQEKKIYKSGLINGGVYALDVEGFLAKSFPEKFSFEKDYLEMYYQHEPMFGLIQDKYFIDIGIPEDYARAQEEFRILNFEF